MFVALCIVVSGRRWRSISCMERVDSVVVMVAGGGTRAENVHDFAHRLFEANDWSARRFVVLAPMLPLQCDRGATPGDLRTLADSNAAAEVLADFCGLMRQRFATPGCHFVGLSNGGIATIQMLLRAVPVEQVLSVTLLASATLNDDDVALVARPDNALCRVPLQTLVGDLDVPFHDAAFEMHAALNASCSSTWRNITVLPRTHHWNIVEKAVENLMRSVKW
jgi:hypothetical protein